MTCPRCKRKGCQLIELKSIYPSGSGLVREVCSDCLDDILKFVDKVPKYNEHSYNLEHYKQAEDCDTMQNRGIMKEWEAETRGKWIFDGVIHDENNPTDEDKYHCSSCGRVVTTSTGNPQAIYPFCHCGADMRGHEK